MKKTKRKGFNFFRSYYDVYNELETDADKVAFMDALLDRQFLGIKPDNLKGMAKFAYISQTNSIDSQVKGYETKSGEKLTPLVGVNTPPTDTPCQGGAQAPCYGGADTPTLQVEVEEKGKGKGKEQVEGKVEDKTLLSEIKISDVESPLFKYVETAKAFQAVFIKNLQEKNSPTNNQEKANFKNYVTPIRLMFENDGVTESQIKIVFTFLQSNEGEFWKANILSIKKLREKFTQLLMKAQEAPGLRKVTDYEERSNLTNAELTARASESEVAKKYRFS